MADLVTAMMVSRFWSLVDRSDGPDACWPWTGYYEDGYGRFFDGGRMRPAHELALTFTTGEVRSRGLDTCHSCHYPGCCNPAHLRFDTRQSNVDDTIRAERQARGEGNGRSRLRETDVVLLRQRNAAGASCRQLATEFGISEALASMIVTGKRWGHAGGPIRTSHGNYKVKEVS